MRHGTALAAPEGWPGDRARALDQCRHRAADGAALERLLLHPRDHPGQRSRHHPAAGDPGGRSVPRSLIESVATTFPSHALPVGLVSARGRPRLPGLAALVSALRSYTSEMRESGLID